VVVKDKPQKIEERRPSVFDFDIPPLWLIQQREQNEKEGPDDGSSLFFLLGW
jgi:hypothetical protein